MATSPCSFCEESGEDELEDGDSRPVLYVKTLPWRHAQVTKFLRQMDHKVDKQKSMRAKMQTLPRIMGVASTRPQPPEFPTAFWGFADGEPK